MAIFEQLQNGKGTISSVLGKELAARIAAGERDVLEEVLRLSVYDLPNPGSKNIRAGAAKAVEIVAEKTPDLVAPHLESLFPGLTAPEPQTRWMLFRTFGLCAALRPGVAARAIPLAAAEIDRKEGLVLVSSVDLYLGDLGAVSREYTDAVFPLLEKSAESPIKNEPDWILEAFIALSTNLVGADRKVASAFAHRHLDSSRKSTVARAKKLLKRFAE